MSASSPSPSSSPSGIPPTAPVIAAPPPQASTPTSTPPASNPPESSTPSSPPPPPPPITSPPPASPPNSATTPPPVTSPPPSTTNPPPPPNAPPPTTPVPPASSPPESPPQVSPPPPVLSPPPQSPPPPPPSDPPSTSAPPPIVTPNSPPPSSSPPPKSSESPPPPPPASPPPVSEPPPPSSNEPATSPPPASSPPPNSPPLAQEPAAASLPSPPTQISPPISHLSPPPVSQPAPSGSKTPNPSLATPPSGNSTDSFKSNSGVPVGGIVGIGVVAGVVLLGLLGIIIWCIYKRRRRDSKHSAVNIEQYSPQPEIIIKTEVLTPSDTSGSVYGTPRGNGHGGLGHSQSLFTYKELYESTNGFAPDSLLGEGGFGSVYKGVLANGREVAVKKLKSYGEQGDREFKVEVEIIGRIHHRHLVSLVGYCIFESQRLLVYEYIPNQTLHHHLHGETKAALDWANRIKIAVGAARGIAYLHEDCHPRIIHRDIKSSNILLDDKYEARVSDFGLAKLVLDMDTHISTRVMGTFGYMAPEYATSGKLTEKSDVYSFGVVLLELITGRRPVDESQPLGDESLVEWARPLLNHALETGEVEGLVDQKLEKNFLNSELLLMIEAAAACVRHSASKRPRMGQVLRAFDGLLPADLSNGMRVGQSEIYDPAQQSEEIRWFRRMAFGSQDYSTDYFSEHSRNFGYPNPAHGSRGADLSAQHRRNQQPSETVYFSSQHSHSPGWSLQNPDFSGHSSRNIDSSGQSSQNPTSSDHSSRNVDSSSRESQSS